MRSSALCILTLGFLIAAASAASADIGLEFMTLSGSTNSLRQDSSEIYDAYSTSTMRFTYYPLSSVEVALTGEYSYYRETIGLGSIFGGIGITYIPTKSTSPFSLYLSGNINGRLYHSQLSSFDNNFGEIHASAGYRILSFISTRAGISFRSTRYVNSENPYKRGLDLFWGANASLPGSNSLDLETGFSSINPEYVNLDDHPIIRPDSLFFYITHLSQFPRIEDKLWIFHFSPRFSRPIGFKTGIKITYSIQRFQNYDKEIILGFSSHFLSPWIAIWDGQSVQVNLKSYLVPRFIVSLGVGYWDKTYLKTALEGQEFPINLLVQNPHPRQDWQTRYYLSLQRPFAKARGLFIEPVLRLEYMKNNSNKARYRFEDFSFSLGLSFRL